MTLIPWAGVRFLLCSEGRRWMTDVGRGNHQIPMTPFLPTLFSFPNSFGRRLVNVGHRYPDATSLSDCFQVDVLQGCLLSLATSTGQMNGLHFLSIPSAITSWFCSLICSFNVYLHTRCGALLPMSSSRAKWRGWAQLGELNPGRASVLRRDESRRDNFPLSRSRAGLPRALLFGLITPHPFFLRNAWRFSRSLIIYSEIILGKLLFSNQVSSHGIFKFSP